MTKTLIQTSKYAADTTFKQVCFEKKCLWVAGCLQSGALYATITHDPRSEYNWQKSECSECQRSLGVWGCSETPVGPLRKLSGSKEHLNRLKIDLNAGKIIFKTINMYKINVNGSGHIKC